MRYLIYIMLFVFCVQAQAQKVRGRDLAPSAYDSIATVIQDSIAFPVDTTALKLLNMDEGRVAYVRDFGLFVVADSADTEGVIQFNHPTSGKSWRSVQYLNDGTFTATDSTLFDQAINSGLDLKVLVDESFSFAKTDTVPSNITLDFTKGAIIDPTGGKLYISADIMTGNQQIFDSSYTDTSVIMLNGGMIVNAQWFGADPTKTNPAHKQIENALLSIATTDGTVHASRLYIPGGKYIISDTIQVGRIGMFEIFGDGDMPPVTPADFIDYPNRPMGTILINYKQDNIILSIGNGAHNTGDRTIIRNMTFACDTVQTGSANTGDGLRINGKGSGVYKNISFHYFMSGHGIEYVGGCYRNKFENIIYDACKYGLAPDDTDLDNAIAYSAALNLSRIDHGQYYGASIIPVANGKVYPLWVRHACLITSFDASLVGVQDTGSWAITLQGGRNSVIGCYIESSGNGVKIDSTNGYANYVAFNTISADTGIYLTDAAINNTLGPNHHAMPEGAALRIVDESGGGYDRNYDLQVAATTTKSITSWGSFTKPTISLGSVPYNAYRFHFIGTFHSDSTLWAGGLRIGDGTTQAQHDGYALMDSAKVSADALKYYVGGHGYDAWEDDGNVVLNNLKINSVGAIIDSAVVVADTLKFYVGGVGYNALKE